MSSAGFLVLANSGSIFSVPKTSVYRSGQSFNWFPAKMTVLAWRSLPLLLSLAATITSTTARFIVPGARWLDTDGNVINAHAGNIILSDDGNTFYWFGEYKPANQTEGAGVSVYSSPDLATWTYHGLALTADQGGGYEIIQRPKVVRSPGTGQYHMWWHADNASYGELLQGFATAEGDPTGPYEFVDATAPLGNWSQDFGMFTDSRTGRSYALYSNGDSVEGRDDYITLFNEDVTALEEVVFRFDKFDLEAPGIVQTDGGSYYILMSHKTGYRPNDVVAFRADALAGPWSQPVPIAPPDTRTWNSQSGFVLRIQGSKATTHLYMGDQWDNFALEDSRYVWLPLTVNDSDQSIKLDWHDVYDLDVETGEWSPVEGTTYTAARHATMTGGAYLQEANFASGGVIATGIYGNESTVTFTGIQGGAGSAGGGNNNTTTTTNQQWVSFYYQNTDDMGFGNNPGGVPDRIGGTWQLRRVSSVVVNGRAEEAQTLVTRDSNKGVLLSTSLLLTLNAEADNTITVTGLSNGFDVKGADLDRIVVYPPEGASGGGGTAQAGRRRGTGMR